MRVICSILLLALTLGPVRAVAQSTTIRLASVPSPAETGLIRDLLPEFERQSGYRVTVYAGEDLYHVARRGEADLVISHYGHHDTDAFMAEGLGLWPRAVFANQIAIFGPAADPAGIRGLQDAGEAFRRIAAAGPPSRFISNNSAIMKYIESVLWEAAGRPARESWYVNTGASEAEGLTQAALIRGYYIFALPPFLRWQESCLAEARASAAAVPRARPLAAPGDSPGAPCDAEALMLAGPMPSRLMIASVVNPQRVAGVNAAGAAALQAYLLRPAVQARIERFRDQRTPHQLWRAAGLHNSAAALGIGRPQ